MRDDESKNHASGEKYFKSEAYDRTERLAYTNL